MKMGNYRLQFFTVNEGVEGKDLTLFRAQRKPWWDKNKMPGKFFRTHLRISLKHLDFSFLVYWFGIDIQINSPSLQGDFRSHRLAIHWNTEMKYLPPGVGAYTKWWVKESGKKWRKN